MPRRARVGKKKRSREIGKEDTTEEDKATPKSIIVYKGDVGVRVRSLMHEWRRVFLPWSSKKLHGKNNTLKDFQHVAATFSVSHLQVLSTPTAGASLRIFRFPSGPTLSFRVESFTLRDDIVAQQRRPAAVEGPAYQVAPILVMNNFNGPDRTPDVHLMESTFQAMFPTLRIHTVKPSDVQRVVLFHYDPTHKTVEVRHFLIGTRAIGLSKTIKKLTEGRLPTKLGTAGDVAEILEKEAAWSDTDGEGEEVDLTQRFKQHRNKTRVKLVEIGPRLTLSLVKSEAGFGSGEVLHHAHVEKTPKEISATARRVKETAGERRRKQKEQEENVNRKRTEREEKLEKRKSRRLEKEEDRKRQRADDMSAPALDLDDDDDE